MRKRRTTESSESNLCNSHLEGGLSVFENKIVTSQYAVSSKFHRLPKDWNHLACSALPHPVFTESLRPPSLNQAAITCTSLQGQDIVTPDLRENLIAERVLRGGR